MKRVWPRTGTFAVGALATVLVVDVLATFENVASMTPYGLSLSRPAGSSASTSRFAFQSGRNQGLGFAAPIDTAVSVMKQLQATGKVTYAYLGDKGQTITSDFAGALRLSLNEGVLVAVVSDGSPAVSPPA